MTDKKLTRRTVAKGLTLSFGALALPSVAIDLGAGAGEIGQDRDDRTVVGPVGTAGPAAAHGLRHGGRRHQQRMAASRALGGAKIEIVYADAGDSTEKAKNAAQRLLSDNPDLVGGTGSWLSSFTLAVTEVTERASVAVADTQLFGRDHQSRVQVRLPDLADRRSPGDRDRADRTRSGASRHRQAPDRRSA